MEEIEGFLDECRADPWFQSHPELVDRLESVLTKILPGGEDPELSPIFGDGLIDQAAAVAD